VRLAIRFALTAFFYVIPMFLIVSFSWAIPPDKNQDQRSLKWENLAADVMPVYNHRNYDNQDLESIFKKAFDVESKAEELVGYVFKRGYLCNDEDKAMCIQKTERLDDNTEKRLTFVVYFFPIGKRNYIYKIEFVDEKRILIPQDQDAGHNLVSIKDWEKYKILEKLLIKQTIIRDGETSLNTGQRIPLDGQPDFIFEDTYVKTKDHTLIHAINKNIKIDEDAPKLFENYFKKMLEYMKNGCD
jgi:hypothetical protein